MNLENIKARRKNLLDEAYAEIDQMNIPSLESYSKKEQQLIQKIARAASASRQVSFGNAARPNTNWNAR